MPGTRDRFPNHTSLGYKAEVTDNERDQILPPAVEALARLLAAILKRAGR